MDFDAAIYSSAGASRLPLRGVANWLRGGVGCDRFRIDVALDKSPLLYSFRFTNSTTEQQILYVGKTPTGWLAHGP